MTCPPRSPSAGDGVPAEGAVGAGTGMIAFDYKAGIGTASRVLPECDATLGVLVLANFGVRDDLVVDGVPVGKLLGGTRVRGSGDGSCIAVVVTDTPLGPHELARVARRCGLGLARTGSVAYDGSGEIFLALSTGGRIERDCRRYTAGRVAADAQRAVLGDGRGDGGGSPQRALGRPRGRGTRGPRRALPPARRGARAACGGTTASRYGAGMCRNIRTLHNFEPPATEGEVQAAALQYVRKVSGSTKPSKANEQAFARAVADIAAVTQRLLERACDGGATARPRARGRQGASARGSALRYRGLALRPADEVRDDVLGVVADPEEQGRLALVQPVEPDEVEAGNLR